MPRDAPATRAVLLARLAMMAVSVRWYRLVSHDLSLGH
jgi:hypothetical protein